MFASLQQIDGKIWVGLWVNTETHFITEVPKNKQWKERNRFCKIVLGLFKVAPCINSIKPGLF